MEHIQFEWDTKKNEINKKTNLIVVCHCYRESDSIIRIISARKATTTETRYYREA